MERTDFTVANNDSALSMVAPEHGYFGVSGAKHTMQTEHNVAPRGNPVTRLDELLLEERLETEETLDAVDVDPLGRHTRHFLHARQDRHGEVWV